MSHVTGQTSLKSQNETKSWMTAMFSLCAAPLTCATSWPEPTRSPHTGQKSLLDAELEGNAGGLTGVQSLLCNEN